MNRPTRGLRAISYFVPFAFYLELRSIFHPLCVAFESICDQFFPPPHVNYGPNNAHARDSHAKIAVMRETMWSANCNWIMQFNFDNCSPSINQGKTSISTFRTMFAIGESLNGREGIFIGLRRRQIVPSSREPIRESETNFQSPIPAQTGIQGQIGIETPTSHHF